jgi:hypothetical protein
MFGAARMVSERIGCPGI